MCFSAEASVTAAAVLVPTGVCTMVTAWRKDTAFLALAAVPLAFGVQQGCEAVVWWGLDHSHPEVVRPAAVAFLLFAIALWPGWVPLAVARLEGGWRRPLFGWLSAVGFAAGFACLVPAATRYGEWLVVAVVGHSVQYDLSGLPGADTAAGVAWQGVYLAAVLAPLLLSTVRGVRWLGVSMAGAAAVAFILYRHAFASVWCFFAAVVSAHIAYLLWRLPEPGRTLSPTPELPSPSFSSGS